MKYLILCLSVLLCNIVCAQDSVKLSGTIVNPVSDSILISYNDNPIAYYPKEYYLVPDKKGNFSMSFPVPHGRYVQAELVHGRNLAEMLVQAGDSLYLSVDVARFDSSLHFTGRGSATENFIAKHTLALGKMNQYTIRVKTAINKEPAVFLKNIEQEKNGELSFLDKNKAGLPESFMKYWTAFYQYYNFFFIQQYPQVHEIVRLRKYTDTIPKGNFAVLKQMPQAFNDSLLQVPSYMLYLTGVFEIQLKAAGYGYLVKDPVKLMEIQDSVNKLANRYLPEKSLEYFTAQNIYGRARSQEPGRTESQFKEFKRRWPKSDFLPVLSKQVAIMERLAPGQPAPDLELVTRDGKTTHLSSLRGKVVYLTFWAGWCKQCVGEMTSMKKVTDLMKDKPLELVYISLNTEKAGDYKIIDKFKFEGDFANITGGWNAKEVQDYGVQSLPAYYLIDEDGNFALQNTPAPSHYTELILAIEKLFH